MGKKKETQRGTDDSTLFAIHALSEKPSKQKDEILTAIQSLERRTFPSSEALAIATETVKRNTHLLYAQSSAGIQGYIIYINTASGLRVHKVCVAEKSRRQGIALQLIARVCQVAEKIGKDVDLWVDTARTPARECYLKGGFTEIGNVVKDYYSPGRDAVRMIWTPE